MEKILNSITCSSDYITGSSTSGTSVVDMSKYDSAVIRGHVFKFDSTALTSVVVATVSVYESTVALNTGGQLLSYATVSLASGTVEDSVQFEIKGTDITDTYRYIYGHVAVTAASSVSVGTSLLIERGQGRYDSQD